MTGLTTFSRAAGGPGPLSCRIGTCQTSTGGAKNSARALNVYHNNRGRQQSITVLEYFTAAVSRVDQNKTSVSNDQRRMLCFLMRTVYAFIYRKIKRLINLMVLLRQLAGILCCRLLLNDLRVDFILEGFGDGLCVRSG